MRGVMIGRVRFIRRRSGLYLSEGGNFAVCHMLEGTAQQQWELYRTNLEDDDEFDDLIDTALTLGELRDRYAKKSFA